jgi:hypothetical protein
MCSRIEELGETKWWFIGKARNLLWSLGIQALFNEESREELAESYGSNMVVSANLRGLMRDKASKRIRPLLNYVIATRHEKDVGISYRGFYGGIAAIYYLGASDAGGSQSSVHTSLTGVELGYTLPIPLVRIRPLVGLGNAAFSFPYASGSGSCQPPTYCGTTPAYYGSFESLPAPAGSSSSHFYVEPGVLVMVPVRFLLVGADVNALMLPAWQPKSVALSAHGQIGVRFWGGRRGRAPKRGRSSRSRPCVSEPSR